MYRDIRAEGVREQRQQLDEEIRRSHQNRGIRPTHRPRLDDAFTLSGLLLLNPVNRVGNC